MYNKLFTKILDSSIWLAPDPIRLVWITLIAAMDEDGNCMFACAANVAARARVSIEQAEAALAEFAAPDPNSGDPENEGRRIERIPGGWHMLNAHKYRAMVTKAIIREQTRLRTEKYRKRDAPVTQRDAAVTRSDAKQGLCDAPVTTSEALAEAASKTEDKNTKKARKRAAPSALVSVEDLVNAGVDRQHADDWLLARKAKKLPLTQTVLADTQVEAIKAGLTLPDAIGKAAANGWAGFKASWLANAEGGRSGGSTPSYLAEKQAEAAKWAYPPAEDFEFIDMEAGHAPLALR